VNFVTAINYGDSLQSNNGAGESKADAIITGMQLLAVWRES